MVERKEPRIYPDEVSYHYGKGRSGPIIPVILEGKAVRWDSFSLLLALTAIHDGRNNSGVNRNRFKAYNRTLYDGARRKDAGAMKGAVHDFSEMVPQAAEILELPDDVFVGAAMYLTEAIW